MDLTTNTAPHFPATPAALSAIASKPATTYGALVDQVAQRLVFATPTAAHRTAICTGLGKSTTTPVNKATVLRDISTFVAPAILNSPYHWAR
jgi:hypothetical protein